MTALSGVVLAGGASRRMGTDKALLEVEGERLVDRAVGRLAEVCDPVVVAVGRRRLDGLGVEQIADDGSGPLAGIVAALSHAATPLLAVVAVDLPDASAAVLADLAQRWSGQAAVAPRVRGFVQPLHAIYATDARDRFAQLLGNGERSPTQALQHLDALIVDVSDGGFSLNLNRPEDLHQAARERR